MSDRNDRQPRQRSARFPTTTPEAHPTPSGLNPNEGVLAAASWVSARGLEPSAKSWDIEIGLDVVNKTAPVTFDPMRETRFQLHIYSEEWGFRFAHAGRHSWIRITDIPFVHVADEHGLLHHTPALNNIGSFVRELETRHTVRFQRRHAAVVTTIAGAEPVIRSWLLSL